MSQPFDFNKVVMGPPGDPSSARRPAPPQVSPDGRFYWDGSRWVPMPGGAPPAAKAATSPAPNRLAGGMVLAGGAIAVVGCFLPWISASAFFATITRDGISSADGQIIAALATLSALIGVLILVRRVSIVVPTILLVLAAVAMWAVIVDYQDVSNRVANLTSDSTVSVVAEVGAGIYATGLGILIWGIGALAAFRR